MISETWTNNEQRMCAYLHNVTEPYTVLVGEEFPCSHDVVIAINDCPLRFAIVEDALSLWKLLDKKTFHMVSMPMLFIEFIRTL